MTGPRQALRDALKQERWPSVLLIGGEDAALCQELIGLVIGALGEEERATGIDRFDAQPMARVLDAARTRPLLGGRRVVIAREPEGFGGASDPARELLIAYLEAPPDHALLVLVLSKIDKRLKVVKAIARDGLVLECTRPREREMSRWVALRAQEAGLRLTGDAIQLIADAVGTDTGLAQREIEKLALIADFSRKMAASDIEQLLSPGRAVGAFALEDALLAGRLRQAIEALDRHMTGASHGAPLALLGRLASICRRLVSAGAVLDNGGGEHDVREALDCHPFVAKKYAQAARRRAHYAQAGLAACVAADGMLKSGGDPREALGRVLLALAPPAASARR